jgi:hypothetical protein
MAATAGMAVALFAQIEEAHAQAATQGSKRRRPPIGFGDYGRSPDAAVTSASRWQR